MNPTQWQQAEELYNAALDVAETERAAFFARACADGAVRREVESLLAARNEAGGFLSQPVIERSLLSGAQRAALNARLGSTIGQYQLLSVLGVGGMGEVFLAADTRLHRQVALKLLPPHFSREPGRVRRFEQEARATTALNHPNIVTLYDTGQHEGSYFIVNEFVDGQTLRAHLNEHGPLSVSEALNIAQQIATALAAAHAAGIVHRDIKPENVMLRRDGFVKVLDFGLAKLTGAALEPVAAQDDTKDEENPPSAIHNPQSQTAAGVLLGTIRYMSPEQARGGTVDARTDVFSLGVVLYEMLTGRTPFRRETATETLAAILEAEPSTLPEHAPAALQCLVTSALRKDRAQRLQTTDEFAAALRNLVEEAQFSARLAAEPWWHGWRRLAASLAIVVVLWLGWRYWAQRNLVVPVNLVELTHTFVGEWKLDKGRTSSDLIISPDDQMIAFTQNLNGREEIFVKPLAGGTPQRLTHDEWFDQNPIWTPEGQAITYRSTHNEQVGFWQVPVNGVESKQIATLPAALAEQFLYLMCWSRDGRRLYFVAKGNVHTLEPATGKFTTLTNFPATTRIIYADLSTDEQWLTYTEVVGGVFHVFALKLEQGVPIQLTHGNEHNGSPVWHPDGKRIIYSAKRNGIDQIAVVTLESRVSQLLTASPESLSFIDITRDGRRILYSTSGQSADLFRYDLASKTETRLTASQRQLELNPNVAPDGRSVIYQQKLAGQDPWASSLWRQATQGDAAPVQLADKVVDARWSPRGDRIAFLRDARPYEALWTMNPDGSQARPVVNSHVLESGKKDFPVRGVFPNNYTWSPDGNQLAYLSFKSGRLALWTIREDGTNEQLIPPSADATYRALSPLFAPDSRRLAYLQLSTVKAHPNQLWLSDAGQQHMVFQTEKSLRLLGWSADGGALFLTTFARASERQNEPVQVLRLALTTGQAAELAAFANAYPTSFRLAPDQQHVAFCQRVQEHDELWQLALVTGQAKLIHTNEDPFVFFAEMAWAPDARTLYLSKQTNAVAFGAIDNFR